jgi:cobalt/nickel transport system ATP-binding protein
MSEYLLEFQDVYYSYPLANTPTLQGLSFQLPKNKKTALIGRNGCGKSTLFLIADALCKPDRGRVLLDGNNLSFDRPTLDRWRQRVGLVFQDPEQQLIAPTVAADVSYGLFDRGLSTVEIAAKVTQILANFHLTELADMPLQHLSLGQKKRVSIAGVMALQPELLLLDEPTAYLDPIQTRNLLTELESIASSGTTLLIATHDLDFVYQWADWVLVMDAGKIIAAGDTLSVFDRLSSLPDYQLGMPSLWQIWSQIAPDNYPHSVPRSIAEIIAYLHESRRDRHFDLS